MAFPPENEALLLTREVGHATPVGERPTGLPSDLLSQSAARLRVLALLYASVYFLPGSSRGSCFPSIGRLFELRHVGSGRDRDRRGAGRRCGDPKHPPSALRRADHRTGIRNGQQLRHRRGRVPRPDGARHERPLDGAVLGRGVDAAVHRRRADVAAAGGGGRAGVGQLGPGRDRARDRRGLRRRSGRTRRNSSSGSCSRTCWSW